MTINYANLILYLSVMGITPGPNNLTCLYLGGRYGLKKSMRFIFASGACIFIKSVVCGVFSMALAETIPKAVNIVKWLGAAYMLYLAYSMMKSGFVKEEGAECGQEESGNPAKSRNDSVETKLWACSSQTAGGNSKVRKEGTAGAAVVLQLLNGKSWIAAFGVFAVYVTPYSLKIGPIFATAAIFMVIVLICSVIWALGGTALRRVIYDHKKIFGIIMGLSLVYCAVTAVL